MTKLDQHFAAIAETINDALNRDPAEGLTPVQRAYWRHFSVADAEAVVHDALGTFDPARGWTAWQPLWNCGQTRQRSLEMLHGVGRGTKPCSRCRQQRAACARGTGGVFFAPESGRA